MSWEMRNRIKTNKNKNNEKKINETEEEKETNIRRFGFDTFDI